VEDRGVHLVHRMSAQLGLPGECCIPVSSNNADMVKFESSQDATFQAVVRGMRKCVGLCLESDNDSSLVETTKLGEGDNLPLEITTLGAATWGRHSWGRHSWGRHSWGRHSLEVEFPY
jgi:hypothetical protein